MISAGLSDSEPAIDEYLWMLLNITLTFSWYPAMHGACAAVLCGDVPPIS